MEASHEKLNIISLEPPEGALCMTSATVAGRCLSLGLLQNRRGDDYVTSYGTLSFDAECAFFCIYHDSFKTPSCVCVRCTTAIPRVWTSRFTRPHQHARLFFGACKLQTSEVSRVYARPRPLRPAGGNTLDDITSPRLHWPRDVPHRPNRLAVKWRQPRPGPVHFEWGWAGRRDDRSQVAAGCWALIGWKSGESERLLLREKWAAATRSCSARKKTTSSLGVA